MKPVLLIGILIVNLALLSYLIATILLFRRRKIGKPVLIFFTLGVLFDLTSTICMILGSSKGIITLHGIIGYSALLGMIIDTSLCYRNVRKNGINTIISNKFRNITLAFYLYWVAAYITGSILVSLRHH